MVRVAEPPTTPLKLTLGSPEPLFAVRKVLLVRVTGPVNEIPALFWLLVNVTAPLRFTALAKASAPVVLLLNCPPVRVIGPVPKSPLLVETKTLVAELMAVPPL